MLSPWNCPDQTPDRPLEHAPANLPVRAHMTKLPSEPGKIILLPSYSVNYTTSDQCAEALRAKIRDKLSNSKPPLFMCVGKLTDEIEIHEIYVNEVKAWPV